MKLATQIFLGFLIAIFIDLLDSSVNYLLTLRVKSNSEFLGRSEAVIRRSADLNKGMLAMQGAFRGYLLTGDTGLLAPYDEGKKEVASSESQLRRLVGLQVQVSILDSIMLLY
ncbi:MAG: CHASE3 domain-containing protein, partial [Bacteroidetes bacterium]|nr:CHASE3 domain-containing protein [Bacteroidota bacterium]